VGRQCENCEKITGGWQIWGKAPQAPTGVKRGVPLPNKGEAPSPEIFLTFWLKIVHFGIYSGKNRYFSIE